MPEPLDLDALEREHARDDAEMWHAAIARVEALLDIRERAAVEAVRRVLDLIEATDSDWVSVYDVAAAVRGDRA